MNQKIRLLSFLLFVVVFTQCRSHTDPTVVNEENAGKGEKLFNTVGCLLCHTITGEPNKYGPPLNDIFNKEVIVVRKGTTIPVKVDRQYIFRSLKEPDFEKVEGYHTKKMTIVNLSDDEINYLVDFLIYINTNKK